MMMMRFSLSSLFIATLVCTTGSVHSAEPASATELNSTVESLGRINGRALACGHADVFRRAKTLVIERVAKTRALGEVYESATQRAFLAQGLEKTACPSREALSVELEIVARTLAKPSAHRIADDALPDTGINPRYLLQASSGGAVMDSNFPDRFQLISFGYTFCPDICPTTLAEMAAILKDLGDDRASRIQTLFFSVDPERDTLAQLKSYTGFFDPRIIGATGSPEFIKRAADNFKVRYEKVIEPGADPANYAVDHSAGMYLLAPGGQFIRKFAYGMPVADIVEILKDEIGRRFPAKGGEAK